MNSKNILEEVKIEGLFSLQGLTLNMQSIEEISLKNLNSLKELEFECSQIDYSLQYDLIDSLKTIEKFNLNNDSFSIDFDKDIYDFDYDYDYDYDYAIDNNDKSLFISFHNVPDGNEEFNFDFIQHLYNRINKLVISNSDYAHLLKLVSEQNFPYLKRLEIWYSNIYRLEKKMLSGSFPAIQSLKIMSNEYLETIDHDAFSNLKHLRVLEINENSIESLDIRLFSELVNLESVSMRRIQLKVIDDANVFSNLKRLETIVINPFTVIYHKS